MGLCCHSLRDSAFILYFTALAILLYTEQYYRRPHRVFVSEKTKPRITIEK